MKEVPYTNTSAHARTIGNKTIAPGETRMVDETLLGPRAAAESEPEPENPLLEMLDGSVAGIVERLPEVSDDELEQLIQTEADGKARKTLMAEIEEEKLRRAQAATGADDQGAAGDQNEDTGESE